VDVPSERYESIDGTLTATTDYAAVTELDALTICVPTPLSKTRTPDLNFIVSAAESVGSNIKPGMLIVLQSTTHPGRRRRSSCRSSRNVPAARSQGLLPRLCAGARRSGQRDVHDQEHAEARRRVTEECLRRTALLYAQIVDTVQPVSSPMVAETAKLHENTFRAVNIALANELALMCDRMGISPWEVIEAASSKPFGFLPALPRARPRRRLHPVVPHFLAGGCASTATRRA